MNDIQGNSSVARVSTIKKSEDSITTEPSRKDSEATIKMEVRQLLIAHVRNEVDFHHKICFRFEKAYRLAKVKENKLHVLNLELIECIGQHSGYIAQDPMSIFYCLFFCIYFNNPNFVEFLRSILTRLPSH